MIFKPIQIQRLSVFITLWIFVSYAQASTVVHVAVASNFLKPMNEIVASYQEQTQHQIRVSSGASGQIFTQIRQGAPYDIFLAANREMPLKLEKYGLGAPASRFTYAVGKLVLTTSKPHSTSVQERLSKADFNKLAIPNPDIAPYGQAAVETMKALKLHEKLKQQMVQGQNVNQSYQFVKTGHADLGFIALSQLLTDSESQSDHWIIPDTLHQPIYQDALLLKRAQFNPVARDFYRFLKSNEVQKILEKYGYQTQGAVQ